jgi:hypothetical protein
MATGRPSALTTSTSLTTSLSNALGNAASGRLVTIDRQLLRERPPGANPLGWRCFQLGLALLHWLSGSALGVLRMILGAAIVLCAVVLLLQKAQRTAPSPWPSTWLAGGLAARLLSRAC